ncbi:MAG TPA: hypothetical protein VJ884_07405 [Salinibacter sp.]|nr:hypothetical protein [Salinibacter sp.]
MPPVSPNTAPLFATEHGTVAWVAADQLKVSLDDQSWMLGPDGVESLHEATEPLAAQVYRCDCDCRWQLRLEGQGTAVLSTDEVLRLHSLLDGAVAMLELYSLLKDASISCPQ